jgi:hypothetical protein
MVSGSLWSEMLKEALGNLLVVQLGNSKSVDS